MESVYLAGAITGLSYSDALDWREEATEELTAMGYLVYSPMREKINLLASFGDTPLPHTHPSFHDPYPRDMMDVRRATFILANLTVGEAAGLGPSVGTIAEINFARGLVEGGNTKFIIVVTTAEQPHPFIAGPADLVVPTMRDAYTWLAAMKGIEAGKFRRVGEIYVPEGMDDRGVATPYTLTQGPGAPDFLELLFGEEEDDDAE